MKKIFFLNLILLFAISITSCTNEDIKTYQATDNIYFSPAVFPTALNGPLVDKSALSFAYDPLSVTKRVFKIPFRVQGNSSAEDRLVSVVADASSTAVAGVHYELPSQVVMRAGKVVDTLSVTLFRTPDMKTTTFTLKLNLQENEFFKTQMTSRENPGLRYVSYTLSFDDILTAPKGWFVPVLGVFSVKKFYLMTSLLGLDPAIFNNALGGPGLSVGELTFYKNFMKRYLADQKAAGNTVYEDNGSEMVFP